MLWLKYLDKDNREIYIYNFIEQKNECVAVFKKNDGMISHVKFLKESGGGGKYVFFVKDTQFIVKLDLETKEQENLGKASDSVIAFNVSYNKLRPKDAELKQAQRGAMYNEDLEQQNNKDYFTVVCLDES